MRLLSWNVQWCRGIDGIVDPSRIAREARRMADPDVLCLQEVNAGFTELPGASGEDQVQALGRELPGYQVFFAAAVDVPAIASGGAGQLEHLTEAREAGADAVLIASILHYGQHTVGEIKAELARAGAPVRPVD